MNKTLVLILVGVVVGTGAGFYLASEKAPSAGGSFRVTQDYFLAGLRAGTTGQLQVSNLGVGSTTAEFQFRNAVFGDADATILSVTTPTSSITAAQLCDNSFVSYATASGANTTSTLPDASDVFTDCLGEIGKYRSLFVRNASTTGVLRFVPGASTTVFWPAGTASTTLNAGVFAQVNVVRFTSSSGDPWMGVFLDTKTNQ